MPTLFTKSLAISWVNSPWLVKPPVWWVSGFLFNSNINQTTPSSRHWIGHLMNVDLLFSATQKAQDNMRQLLFFTQYAVQKHTVHEQNIRKNTYLFPIQLWLLKDMVSFNTLSNILIYVIWHFCNLKYIAQNITCPLGSSYSINNLHVHKFTNTWLTFRPNGRSLVKQAFDEH